MARSFNQVVIMGNLTKDPELRTTPNGAPVCSFTVALNRAYKVNDQWQEATDFIDCVAWAKLAEQVSGYTQKGNPILISGRLQSRSWEQDGQKRSKVEVVCQDVVFLTKDRPDVMPHETVLKDIPDEPINLDEIPF